MPELPEVETVRRGLLGGLLGNTVRSVCVRERRLRRPVDPRALRRYVCGREVTDVERRAKYLIVHFGDEGRLLVHLGMSGRLLLRASDVPQERHEHVVFRLDDGLELRFCDHRRFGLVEGTTAARLSRDTRLVGLGVEPLSAACTPAHLRELAQGLRCPIKNFLMDARKIAGVGNIYANEALYLAGVHPKRAAGRLSAARWEVLTRAVRRVLKDAIRQGGTTLSDFQNTSGDAGYFQVSLRVYGREGAACEGCGSPLRKVVLAGRSTFYCTNCQR